MPCYNDAVARISAEAHGTLMITVLDLHSQGTVDGEAERGKIHRGVLAIPKMKSRKAAEYYRVEIG